MKVKSQEFSELDIGGRETCKHNFENSDIFLAGVFLYQDYWILPGIAKFCRRLSMLWDKLYENFLIYFYAALFFRVLGFQSNISQYIHFLLKVTHVHSTAGYEQVIPRLQLACDSSGFVFQKVSQILVCFLIFGTLTDSIEYVVVRYIIWQKQ